MTTISILPEQIGSFRAVAGTRESVGRTAGEALDLLSLQLEDDENGTPVIVQKRKADAFFNQAQQNRLTELMRRRSNDNLTEAEEIELEQLIEVELDRARERAEKLTGRLLP